MLCAVRCIACSLSTQRCLHTVCLHAGILQDALETCTEEEAEQQRPLLMDRLMQVEGDAIKKKYESVEKLMDDKNALNSVANRIALKGKKLEQRAKGTREVLATEKVQLPAYDDFLHIPFAFTVVFSDATVL